MKKLLILFVIVAACLNFTCKCGCEQPTPYVINLVVKNLAGEDLLNPTVNGSFSATDIKLYKVDNGMRTPLRFEIHMPVTSGSLKNQFYRLVSDELGWHSSSPNHFTTSIPYIQFKDEEPYKLAVQFDEKWKQMSLYANGYEMQRDENWPVKNSLFHFIKR